ncbi:unnamed protein product [Symbiodinium sp. CCMP2592]|nr:unnamed protein product [Symbiodinium sp. CCMP2592]
MAVQYHVWMAQTDAESEACHAVVNLADGITLVLGGLDEDEMFETAEKHSLDRTLGQAQGPRASASVAVAASRKTLGCFGLFASGCFGLCVAASATKRVVAAPAMSGDAAQMINERLVLDCGGVLSVPSQYGQEKYDGDDIYKSAIPGAYAFCQKFMKQYGSNELQVISRVNFPSSKKHWVVRFCESLGLSENQVHLVTDRKDKGPKARELGCAVAVDDQSDCLYHIGVCCHDILHDVKPLILFSEKGYRNTQHKWDNWVQNRVTRTTSWLDVARFCALDVSGWEELGQIGPPNRWHNEATTKRWFQMCEPRPAAAPAAKQKKEVTAEPAEELPRKKTKLETTAASAKKKKPDDEYSYEYYSDSDDKPAAPSASSSSSELSVRVVKGETKAAASADEDDRAAAPAEKDDRAAAPAEKDDRAAAPAEKDDRAAASAEKDDIAAASAEEDAKKEKKEKKDKREKKHKHDDKYYDKKPAASAVNLKPNPETERRALRDEMRDLAERTTMMAERAEAAAAQASASSSQRPQEASFTSWQGVTAMADSAWADNSQGNLCAEHLIRVHEALKAIRDCSVFDGIDAAEPLTIAQGGHQEPFAIGQAVKVFQRDATAHYSCGGNFFWCDQVWMANHRVPINKGQVQEIQRFYLPPMDPPKEFTYEVVAAVSAACDEEFHKKGSFQRLSPAEPCHALLFSIHEAISAKAPEPILRRWKELLLTTPFRFELVPQGEARFWRAQNLREEMVERGITVRLSVRQRIYDVAGFKASKEAALKTTLGAAAVASAYQKHLKASAGSEIISESFVDSAITVHDRLLSIPACSVLLEELDAQYLKGNPLSSIYAFQAIIDKAQTPKHITWAVEGMIDGFRKGFVEPGFFAVSKLRDARNSYVEILKLKLAVKNHLLEEWLTGSTFPGKTKEADTAWILGAKDSVVLAAELLMDIEAALRKESKPAEVLFEVPAAPAGSGDAPASSTGTGSAASAAEEAKLTKDEQQQWRQFMLKNLRSQVRFVSDHKAASDLEQAIRDCPFSKLKGDPTGLVLLHFDVKKFGESATRPDLRLPPLRDGPYTRLVRAVMTARQSEGSAAALQPGEVAVLLDGFKKGAKQKLINPWKDGTRKEAKGKGSTKEDEDEDDGDGDDDDCEEEEDTRPNLVSDLLQIGYTEALSLPARERKHYGPGSSTGDLISGDGRFAFEALKARVGYMGITFTPEHSQFLEEHLLDLMKLEMCDTASPLFNSEYAAAVGKKVPKAKANPDEEAEEDDDVWDPLAT